MRLSNLSIIPKTRFIGRSPTSFFMHQRCASLKKALTFVSAFFWLPLLGAQRQNATGWRFGKAKSSAQGVEGASICDTQRLCGRTGRVAGTGDSLRSRRSVGETAGERARMPQGHFFIHCVYSGRREPYGTPFLPPAGGAKRGVFA